MTRFQDGSAAGKTLMLRRAPVYLRVTEKAGKFDGLDQLEDRPEPGEKLTAYVLASKPGACFIRAARGSGAGGRWPVAEYKVCDPQPTEEQMRARGGWEDWTAKQGMPAHLE